MPKSVQVITDGLEYVDHIENYLVEEEMDKVGASYRNVAIIGCQSSGKSTLLNILFDTDFEELDQQNRGMAQTTKGIWVARNGDKNILVFDIEGTDSKERGDDRLTFEQTTSLFALALSDVLIINLWVTDVGRHTASNLGLLKVIFEVNLKLFAQDQSQKKLVFVIRDFNKFQNNEEHIRSSLDKNVNEIWDQIYKNEEHEHSKPKDFFDFEFVMLPHKLYQEEDFKTEALKLRQRFNDDDPNTVFPTSEKPNVPIDGLSMFINNIWTCIRERKELNLPGEKEMVATFRCGEIKDEAIEKVSGELTTLENLSTAGGIPDFENRCRQVLKIAFDHYDESAVQYYTQTYEKVRLELSKEIMKKLTDCYENQIASIRIETEKKFDKALKTTFGADAVTDTFVTDTQNLKAQSMATYEQNCTALIMKDSEWRYDIQLNQLSKLNFVH